MNNGKGLRKNVICKNCNVEFSALLIKLRRGAGLFCSRDCYFKFRTNNKKDEKYSNRIYQKKHKYGLTEEQYLNLFKIQNNKCIICNISFKKKKAHVDHCHSTKKVRGLLCNNCNSLIGFANDKIEILESAIKYLRS